MKITDVSREELIRQVILYKVPVNIACESLGIKYITANNIVKLFQKAMYKGIKSRPRPKELDIVGSNLAVKKKLPSYEQLVEKVEDRMILDQY